MIRMGNTPAVAPVTSVGVRPHLHRTFTPPVSEYEANIWVDASAVADAGWVYNGNGTWTATAVSSKDVYITNLGDAGGTYRFIIEVISCSAGNIKPKLRGTTVDIGANAPGTYTVDVTDTSGFARTGISGQSGFTGTIRVVAVQKKIELPVEVPVIAGTTYFVADPANGGSDTNDGLSPDTPWATVAKVNASSFSPGDGVAFRCGDTWNERLVIPSSGTEGNPITFTSYDTGPKPVLDGTGVTLVDYEGLLHVGNKDYVNVFGIRVEKVGDQTRFLDAATGVERIGINCTIGASHIWIKNCEVESTEAACIRAHGANNITIEGNTVKLGCIRSLSECISISNGSYNIEIMDNHVSENANVGLASGGSGIDIKSGSYNARIYNNTITGMVDVNAIYADAWDATTVGIVIENNLIYDTTGPGIMIGSEEGGDLVSPTVRNNVVIRALKGALVFHNKTADQGDILDPTVYGNTFVLCGDPNEADTGGVRILDDRIKRLKLINNIIAFCYNFPIGKHNNCLTPDSELDIDNNLLYHPGTLDQTGGYTAKWGTNRVNEDPLFTDIDNDVLTLKASPVVSPAINAGVDVWAGVPDVISMNGVRITDSSGNTLITGSINLGAYQ